MSKLFADSTSIALASFISRYRKDRDSARKSHKDAKLLFIEIYVDVPVEVAEQRDPKGLYKKACAGEIKALTGISVPYEAPEKPEIRIESDKISVKEAVAQITEYLIDQNIISV